MGKPCCLSKQIAWAASVLRLHADGDFWLWREKSVLFRVEKERKWLILIAKTDNLMDQEYEDLVCVFGKFGYDIMTQCVRVVSETEWNNELNIILHIAKKNNCAIVDYGKEMAVRMLKFPEKELAIADAS